MRLKIFSVKSDFQVVNPSFVVVKWDSHILVSNSDIVELNFKLEDFSMKIPISSLIVSSLYLKKKLNLILYNLSFYLMTLFQM